MARADMHVEVVYCPQPGTCDSVALTVAPGTTVAGALQASGLLQRHALAPEGLRVGVWGQLREPGSALRERDRVEIYRGLVVDPKEARRQRYQRHRERTAAR
jgi:putative ubiquitin-RnfH superfamily antitoxin RatB of RatAB toxin-antitoxin module